MTDRHVKELMDAIQIYSTSLNLFDLSLEGWGSQNLFITNESLKYISMQLVKFTKLQ